MELYDAINNRFSVRLYEDRPVEEEKLQRVLAAAQAAPTARNRQQWKLIVVRDAQTRLALSEAAGQVFIGKAPVVLAVVGLTPGEAMFCGIPTDPVDCAIVLDHIALGAVAEGLGSCWIGHFDQDECRAILKVPATARIVELMPLGYPAAAAPATKRLKALTDLVAYETFA